MKKITLKGFKKGFVKVDWITDDKTADRFLHNFSLWKTNFLTDRKDFILNGIVITDVIDATKIKSNVKKFDIIRKNSPKIDFTKFLSRLDM